MKNRPGGNRHLKKNIPGSRDKREVASKFALPVYSLIYLDMAVAIALYL
jgi:hypothetical protein